MKHFLLLVSLLFSLSALPAAAAECFWVQENNIVIQKEGDCATRYAPESTFKIALSLMGYDSRIFKDETHPKWKLEKDYSHNIEVCKDPHTPKTWMRDSCVWYSQMLTQKLGEDKLKKYLLQFQYGNQDISGNKGKGNNLTQFWLSNSLQISPEEQTVFLQRILTQKLKLNTKAYNMTEKIMYLQELPGGWKLYGKTGTGRLFSSNGSQKLNTQHGWFVGWIEKNGRDIVFATHIVDDKNESVPAGFRAKNDTLIKLWFLIESLEK